MLLELMKPSKTSWRLWSSSRNRRGSLQLELVFRKVFFLLVLRELGILFLLRPLLVKLEFRSSRYLVPSLWRCLWVLVLLESVICC
ncbi:hypothetical protein LINPERHAP1_LOCUS7004 [Linum perenne]